MAATFNQCKVRFGPQFLFSKDRILKRMSMKKSGIQIVLMFVIHELLLIIKKNPHQRILVRLQLLNPYKDFIIIVPGT